MLFRRYEIDVRKAKNGLRRYLHEELYPKLEMPEVPFRMILPMWGSKTLVFQLELENGERYFARLYRPWQRPEAEKNKMMDELLLEHGVRVPRVVDYADMPKRYYSIITIEEFLDGRAVKEEDYCDELTRKIAANLAAMHSARAEQWGEPPKPNKNGGLFPHVLKRVTNRLNRIQKHGVMDVKGEKGELRQAFASFREKFENLKEFNLTHDKIHVRNMMLLANGELVFVDFPTAYYSFFAKDLVTVQHCYCSDKREKIENLDREYFALMNHQDRENFEILYPYYHAWFHISQCAMNCHGAKHCREAGQDYAETFIAEGKRHWELAHECIADEKGFHGEEEALTS